MTNPPGEPRDSGLVVDTGLEPVTSSMSRKRANQLRQSTIFIQLLEVETGFEPVYKDLQSFASPLGHSTARHRERMTGLEPATFTLAR